MNIQEATTELAEVRSIEKPLNPFQILILKALNTPSLRKHVYGGTVSSEEKAKRRKANKVARLQRRKNRK